jgi:hypothetical protein
MRLRVLAAQIAPVTIARTPLFIEAGWRDEITVFRKTEAEYFLRQGWTVESALNRLANFRFSRTRLLVRHEPP